MVCRGATRWCDQGQGSSCIRVQPIGVVTRDARGPGEGTRGGGREKTDPSPYLGQLQGRGSSWARAHHVDRCPRVVAPDYPSEHNGLVRLGAVPCRTPKKPTWIMPDLGYICWQTTPPPPEDPARGSPRAAAHRGGLPKVSARLTEVQAQGWTRARLEIDQRRGPKMPRPSEQPQTKGNSLGMTLKGLS